MSRHLAVILGVVAGAVAFASIVVYVIWFCCIRSRSASRTSETGSSEPSYQGNTDCLSFLYVLYVINHRQAHFPVCLIYI